jgi:hypothetical protein
VTVPLLENTGRSLASDSMLASGGTVLVGVEATGPQRLLISIGTIWSLKRPSWIQASLAERSRPQGSGQAPMSSQTG